MSNATAAAAGAAAEQILNDYADDATWVLTSSFVILTMQSGFGLLEMGSSAPGFEVNIMMKNVVDGTSLFYTISSFILLICPFSHLYLLHRPLLQLT